MGKVTITVPAEHSHVFRIRLVEAFGSFADDVRKKTKRYVDRQEDEDREALEAARARLHELEALLDRIGWQTPDEEAREFEVSADPQLFEPMLTERVREIGDWFASSCQDAATVSRDLRSHRIHVAHLALEQFDFFSRALVATSKVRPEVEA